MDLNDPSRRVTLIALDDRWQRLIPWAVVAAVALLAFSSASRSPEAGAKPVSEYADKFEWILMEPQEDGRTLARTFASHLACTDVLIPMLEARMKSAGEPGWNPNLPPPECIPGKLIESPRS